MSSNLSILVIDDEPDNFDVIETFLSGEGYGLYYAPCGQDGLFFLETFAPDLILLDVMMPGLDGIEVCQRIKSRGQEFIPIIMVTALSEKEDLARCLNAGADDFISKPVNPLELRARVRSHMRGKQNYDRLQNFSKIQRETIEVLSRNLDELNSSIARSFPHELNTPLNGIIGIVDVLRNNFPNMHPAQVDKMLRLIDISARRLENLTRKFLFYLELELLTGEMREKQTLSHRYNCDHLRDILQDLAGKYDRPEDLILHLEEARVGLSEKYFTSIFRELVDNAFKCSPAKTPVMVSARSENGRLYISVKDLGWGMTREQIDHISSFRQFERDIHEQQGIGLGLKIVQKVVELASGQFSISSIYRSETAVSVVLPIVSP